VSGDTFLGVARAEDEPAARPAAIILGAAVTSPYPGRTPHSTEAPGAIRAASLRMSRFVGHHDFDTDAPFAPWHARVADGGDLGTHPRAAEHNRLLVATGVGDVLAAGALPILLGGDDSTAIPFLAAFEGHGPVSVVQIDAHLDFRDEVDGFRFGYSSPMRRASEMSWVRRIVHVGQRGVGSARPSDVRDSRAAGNSIVTARELASSGPATVARLLDVAQPFVIVLDVDGIDPTEVPAVRAPVPSGPSAATVTALCADLVGRGSFRGLVVTELEPSLDVNGISALTVARLICRVLDAALLSS
jgi:agmatinase